MKNKIYLKSKKLILVIFLGLYYYTIEKFTIFIVNDFVTNTILLSTILLPFATSKYINISNIDSNQYNNNNNNKIDLTYFIENSTNVSEKNYRKNDDIIKKIYKNHNRKIRRYKKNIWPFTTNTTTSITDNDDSMTGINDFLIIKNDSIKLQKSIKYNLTINQNHNNYYYEEQKPLIIVPSESGSIPITDYTGTVKKPLSYSTNSNSVTNTDNNDDDDDRNFERNNNHFYDNSEIDDNRYKYVVTTSTPLLSGISDLSSKEMDEYDDNYQNDYDRQKYNDEIENNDNENNINDNQPQITSYMETAKNIWDIFTAINAAWSSISQKQTNEIEKNSRKFYENPIESTTTITTDYQKQNNTINFDERLKRNTNYTKNDDNNIFYKSIESRTDMNIDSSTDIGIAEGRYIKGDPLKGYYDFVITEGSYKFWAAFQFATAILIIYSTFAAIYYSKVNPLVGDYDYVDYLGGGRSFTNNNDNVDDDTDFIDLPYSESRPKLSLSNNDNNIDSKSYLSSILETASSGVGGDWIPKMGHTLKFILDAIDKIPQ